LQRLIRLVAEEQGVHAFIHRATADQGVVEEARSMTQALLRGLEVSDQCRKLCLCFGVSEPLLRARLWAVASLFPGHSTTNLGPYQILGVEPMANPEAIKRAFRKLCLQWHPDLNPGNPEASKRFQQIKAAYDMVTEPETTAGWTPPPVACVWEEGLQEEKSSTVWARMRLLTPLGIVVVLLVLAVGFADMVTPRLRSKSVLGDMAIGPQGPSRNASAQLEAAMSKEPLFLSARDDKVKVAGVQPKGKQPDQVEPSSRPQSARQEGEHTGGSNLATADRAAVQQRLESFLEAYARDYSRRDLHAFLAHFAPQALENGAALQHLLPVYEESFRSIPTMQLRIESERWAVQGDGILFEGRFELRGVHADARLLSSSGTLSMALKPFGDTYLIQSLNSSLR
jgi:DnaJ-domain-containing protein 1